MGEVRRVRLANWGNFPRIEAEMADFAEEEELAERLRVWGSLIPRGLGRCYGDSALAPRVLSTRSCRRILAFDPEGGTLVCEAGTSLGEILATTVPRGWFLPVVPGTRFVTVGGAIASDVHGKNHHGSGTFSRHVEWIDIMTADGSVRRCGPAEEAELFRATCGGMGLTGVILRASIQLRPVETAYIRQETRATHDLDAVMALFEETEDRAYSVAWIDCQARGARLGRSVLFLGEHCPVEDLPPERRTEPLLPPRRRSLRVPVSLPSGLLNRWTIRAFNALYHRRARAVKGVSVVDYETFFFPLDRILEWNRIYGRRGFVQYQFVLPKRESAEGIPAILERIAASGLGSFLAVLKLLGRGGEMLSFPVEGYTLALDFPATSPALRLLDELDRLVLRFGGRLYLTKDARMPLEMLERGYPELERFRRVRRAWDPEATFASLQSRRLEL